MSKRIGDWMQTYTGQQFWPLDPRPEEIHIRDVAHALSNLCRFTGHVERFYSVAEHSVRVSEIVPAEHALWGLLHDASEAYLTDLCRPLKRSAGFADTYLAAEERLMAAVCEMFDLPMEIPPEVKHADNVLLMTEARDLMKPAPVKWQETTKPLPEIIVPWTPERAERAFLRRYAALASAEAA